MILSLIIIALGVALVLSLIGAALVASRGMPIGRRAKIVSIIISALQAAHIVLYVTSAMAKMYYSSPAAALIISCVLTVVCVPLSVWLFFPKAECRHGIKFILAFLSLLQIMTVLATFVF